MMPLEALTDLGHEEVVFHQDPANRWLRQTMTELYAEQT